MGLIEDDPAQKPIDGLIIIRDAGQTPALLNVSKGNAVRTCFLTFTH
jgi:hypothetical protein